MKKATLLFIIFAIGGYHLFIYCSSSKIPVPFDLFTAGSALLIFGVTTILTTVSIGFTPCALLAITPALQESRIYQELFYIKDTKHHSDISNSDDFKLFFKGLKYYCFLFTSTIIFLMILTLYSESIDPYLSGHFVGVIFIEVFFSSLFFSIYMLSRKRVSEHLISLPKTQMLFKRLINFICISFVKTVWIFSLCVTIFWLTVVFKVKSDAVIIACLLMAAVINCIFLIPKEKLSHFKLMEHKYSNKKGMLIDSLKNTYAPSIIVMLVVLIALLFHPTLVEQTSAMTLKMLRLGGDMTAVYYYNPKDKDDLPPEILDTCTAGKSCKTKELHIIIDIGSTFFVKVENGLIYSLPRSKLWPVISAHKEVKKTS